MPSMISTWVRATTGSATEIYGASGLDGVACAMARTEGAKTQETNQRNGDISITMRATMG